MKRFTIFFILLTLAVFYACSEKNEPSKKELFVGVWSTVPPDFTITYKSDGTYTAIADNKDGWGGTWDIQNDIYIEKLEKVNNDQTNYKWKLATLPSKSSRITSIDENVIVMDKDGWKQTLIRKK